MMDNVYKARKLTYIIPIILFGGAIPLLIYIWFKDLFANGFTTTAFAGILAIALDIAAFVLFLFLFFVDPYKRVRQIKESDPQLFADMEADVNQATQLCKNVSKGQRYYFFSGRYKFVVVPIGQLRFLRVVSGYRRGIGSYVKYKIKTDAEKATIIVSVLGQDTERAKEVAQMLAQE